MADNGQKSEQPTQRRMDRARKEGNYPSSREFVSGVQFLVFVALLAAYSGTWFFQVLRVTKELLRKAFTSEVTPENLVVIMKRVIGSEIGPLLAGGFVLVAVVTFIQLATKQFGFAGNKLTPDFTRLNFFSKIKSLPGQNIP